jgi:hypothetical protein
MKMPTALAVMLAVASTGIFFAFILTAKELLWGEYQMRPHLLMGVIFHTHQTAGWQLLRFSEDILVCIVVIFREQNIIFKLRRIKI